jgi:pyruvate/2-oxoglutarate dehydrogenase complex dihydrolipoamide dehydrogenase (E3) component
VLFEREHLGGSCVNFGCTPSKAMIASARLAADARHGDVLGIHVADVRIDFPAVMNRARRLANEGAEELARSFSRDKNIQLIREHARLEGRDGGFLIRAGSSVVQAERVVLDTGNRTARPPIPGLADVPLITAENWIALRELPAQLILLGGSYIALEMAQAFQRLGSKVTVIQKADRLAEREDPDVGDMLRQILERDGCRIYLNADVRRLEAAGAGVRVHLPAEILEGTHLFLAVGRQPNTDDLGLDLVGVETDQQGYVTVDDRLQSTVKGIWAAGDIRGGPAFTHAAYDDNRVLESQLLGDGGEHRGHMVPYAMFTTPELGRVGLSEAEARKTGKPVKVGKRPMSESGKAREIGETDGFIKVVIDGATETILGATVLCEQGSEIVQLFVELMHGDAKASDIRRIIHIHPTLAEAAKNAVLSALG